MTQRNDERARFAQDYLENLRVVLDDVPVGDLARTLEVLETALIEQKQVFVAGNGGSASTASHMASDLMKGVAKGGGKGLRVISLCDNVPLITSIANDENYTEIYAGQLGELAKPGDVLVVISGSGNSANIVRVVEVAQHKGMTSVAFLGKGGGRVAGMVDVSVIVPSDDYGPIEDVHLVFNHLATSYLRGRATALSQGQS